MKQFNSLCQQKLVIPTCSRCCAGRTEAKRASDPISSRSKTVKSETQSQGDGKQPSKATEVTLAIQ